MCILVTFQENCLILNPRHVVFYTDEHWHEMLFEEEPMCEIQLTTLDENFHSLDFKQLS